jgi:hypothetical protein
MDERRRHVDRREERHRARYFMAGWENRIADDEIWNLVNYINVFEEAMKQ